MLSVLGGVLGVGLRFVVAEGVCRSGWMTTTVTSGSVAVAAGCAPAFDLRPGVDPARRAAASNPIDALRFA